MIFGQPLSVFFSLPWVMLYIEVAFFVMVTWQVIAALGIGKGLSEIADAIRQRQTEL